MWLARKILYDWMGWSVEMTIPHPDKYIIAIAPHTSNWDFIIGQLYSRAEGFRCNFMMKKEWFFWPLGILMRKIGGIPVYRSKNMRMTETMAEQARSMKEFHLAITPEGTRKPVKEWKKGFYYIALNAHLPILLYGLDFKHKRICCTKQIIPNGDVEAQMQEIKKYFQQFEGKYPEKFLV